MKNLLKFLQKYPQALTQELEEYLIQPDNYYSGVFSFKYCYKRLEQSLKENELFNIFRQVAEQLIVYGKNVQTQKINRLPALMAYQKELKYFFEFDINTLETFVTQLGYTGIINNTEYNLTSKIFRKTKVDFILFLNPKTSSWGIVFYKNSELSKEEDHITNLTLELSKNYNFQFFAKEYPSLIINYRDVDGMSLDILVELSKTFL